MSNQISNSNFYNPQNVASMGGTQSDYNSKNGDKSIKSFYYSNNATNQEFNKTSHTNSSQLKIAATPILGQTYSSNQFRKLHSVYNCRNTKSINGGMSEVTTGNVFLIIRQNRFQRR